MLSASLSVAVSAAARETVRPLLASVATYAVASLFRMSDDALSLV